MSEGRLYWEDRDSKYQPRDRHIPCVITIDPGVKGTGIAFWDEKKFLKGVPKLLHCEILSWSRTKEWKGRVEQIIWKFDTLVRYWRPSLGVIELPAFFGDAGGTMVAARGDLVKLTYCAGSLAGCLYAHKIAVRAITPMAWKGQLSKEQMERRMRRDFPVLFEGANPPKSHALDAVGLGLYAMGAMK